MAGAKDRYVQLKVEDGSTMAAYVSRPSSAGKHPSVMVFQEAFGVNAHIRDVTDRFAAIGYTAVAPELYHRTGPGYEGSYTDFEANRPHFSAITAETLEKDIRATFGFLRSEAGADRIVSIGFCMGGRVSFLANATVPVRAAASLYGGGIAPALLGKIPSLHGPMLFCWGVQDKHITPEQRTAITEGMNQAGKSYVNAEFSTAGHGFFCDARAAYDKNAAREAWSLIRTFFEANLE